MALFLKRFLVGLGHVQLLVELMKSFDEVNSSFFVTVGFVYSWCRFTVTDGRCRQMHLTRHFSLAQCAHWMMYTHIMAQDCVLWTSSILMVIHVVRLIDRLFSLCSWPCSFPCVSPIPCSSLSTSTCALSWTSSSMWTTPRQLTTGPPPPEESCLLAEFTPLTSSPSRERHHATHIAQW